MADDRSNGPWGRGPSLGDFAAAGLDKARAFLAARNPDAAIREAEKVFAQDPNGRFGFEALDVIGDAWVEKGDHATVMKIGRELLSIDPERIEGYDHLARGALEKDDMRTCIDAIERGLERYPHSLSLTLLNAIRFRRCHDHGRAVAWAEKAVEIAPWHPGALTTLGFALQEAERPEEAQRAFEEARALDPAAGHTMRTAALVAFGDNRFAEAQDLALKGLALDPQDETCSQLVFRARVFKNVLMRPYWKVHQLSKAQAAAAGAVMLALLVVLSPLGLAQFLFAGLALYYFICMFIVLLVQTLDHPNRPKKKPTLKNY